MNSFFLNFEIKSFVVHLVVHPPVCSSLYCDYTNELERRDDLQEPNNDHVHFEQLTSQHSSSSSLLSFDENTRTIGWFTKCRLISISDSDIPFIVHWYRTIITNLISFQDNYLSSQLTIDSRIIFDEILLTNKKEHK